MITAGFDFGVHTIKMVTVQGHDVLNRIVLPRGERSSEELVNLCISKSELSLCDLENIAGTGAEKLASKIVKSFIREPLCIAKGIGMLYPGHKGLVVDIGLEKIIALKCSGGKMLKVSPSSQCASGTGKYLQVIADILNVGIEEFGERSLNAKEVIDIQNMCTVFAESDVISTAASHGSNLDGILMGACKAVAQKVYSMLLNVGIDKEIVFCGGVARNKGVVKAMEDNFKLKVTVPEVPEITGALGAAILAQD